MKRSPFKPRKGKIWKGLNRVSKSPHRRAKRLVPPASIAVVKARSGGQCEVYSYYYDYRMTKEEMDRREDHLSVRCKNVAQPIPHHKLARSQGGGHEPSNLIDICSQCHGWVHDNPTNATLGGLTIPYKGFIL